MGFNSAFKGLSYQLCVQRAFEGNGADADL